MKALVFKRYGGPDQVAFADIPRPVPKPDEILVLVHAAGLNPIDNMILKGTFKPIRRFQLPATLGSDLAGVGIVMLSSLGAYAQEVPNRTDWDQKKAVAMEEGRGAHGKFGLQLDLLVEFAEDRFDVRGENESQAASH